MNQLSTVVSRSSKVELRRVPTIVGLSYEFESDQVESILVKAKLVNTAVSVEYLYKYR